ncbi:CsiV family protein [Sulfuriflexus mobilis]|uniref:CsiV family protein n=1 Tax=Sulfuriflexus mobilis TaxID=1811807 RepID=UPI001559CAA4|nr:CsiV family protein [Sulfuriflexus mobilis]
MAIKTLTYTLFTGLLGIIAVSLVHAAPQAKDAPRWFQVELIVFEPIQPVATGEVWPVLKPDEQTGAEVIELAPPLQPVVRQGNPRAFQLLNPAEFAMTDLDEKLLNSRQYRVLGHIAWRQPTVERAESRAVHVHAGLMQDITQVQASRPTQVLNTLPDPLEQADSAGTKRRFDGTITLSLSRYLHLEADITYYNPDVYLAEQIAQQNIDAPTIEYFRLQESRRMRSTEIHYIDHPYFGIIALITPFEHEGQ